jgi:chaperonin GroEL (HSP60 family)
MADNYRDFAMMCGCEIIREDSFTDFAQQRDETEGAAENAMLPPKREIKELIGSVSKMTVTDSKTTVSGFTARNESMYKLYLDDASDKYNQARKDCEATGILTNNLFSTKKRYSRLTGRIGIIKIGGQNSMEKEANYDAIEDAIKACESAYLYGFNIGGSLSIPVACKNIKATHETLDASYCEVLNCIEDAMKDVFKEVLSKYYTEPEEESIMDDIINKCVEEKICYNLITHEYSMDVINPCMTDIEVLKGTGSLCSVLLTSNQYLAMMPKEEII